MGANGSATAGAGRNQGGPELDYLVALGEMVDLLQPDDEEARLVRNSRPFHRLPIATVAKALGRLQRLQVRACQGLVRQDEPRPPLHHQGGRGRGVGAGLYDHEPQLVNKLAAGDGFGQEALVMGGSHGATVHTFTQNDSQLQGRAGTITYSGCMVVLR